MSTPVEAFVAAVQAKDATQVRHLLERHQDVREAINRPLFSFESRAIHAAAKDAPTLDVLIEFGADINATTDWWAGGFTVFDSAGPEMVDALIERGAILTPHAAAQYNRLDALRKMLQADPSLANAQGGDGQRPLHVAGSTESIDLLLEFGADLNARDVDHEATPAQYQVDRPTLCRHLVGKGAETDLLMDCALGEMDRVRSYLRSTPDAIAMRVDDTWFPQQDPRAGGHIYKWKLGFYRTAFQVARENGHLNVIEVLHQFATPRESLLDAIWTGEEARMQSLLAEHPGLANSFEVATTRQIADAAFHNDSRAVELFLQAGFPADVQGHNRATPLHWAAHHGNADMARTLLAHHPPLDERDGNNLGTPLGWCLWGSGHRWPSSSNCYEDVLRLLLEAGATVTPAALPTGNPTLDAIILDHLG